MHPAYAGHQSPEDPKARHKPSQEDSLASVTGKEPLRSGKTLRGYKDVAPPAQDERTSPFTAYPIADLISDHGPEDAEYDGVP